MGKVKTTIDTSGPAASEASNVTPIDRAARRKPTTLPAGPEAVEENGAPVVEPHLVVFGLDDAGKAHASWFGVDDAELAIKAAGMMRFSVLPITTDEHRAAASGLATGRVFASGKAYPLRKDGRLRGFKSL